ncbi:MAG TPA: hypothetical protein VFH61_13115, partial [Thermoleophilia bacterium]|nr:hypothetical protein [Thermoleophilia bacterium]
MDSTEKDDIERFEVPGFLLERRGRFLQLTSTLDAAEHAEARRRLGGSALEIEQEMVDAVADLYRILHAYTPQAMIAAMWFRNSPFGSLDGGSSPDSGTLSHGFVEFIATLYMRDPGAGEDEVVLPTILEQVQSRVLDLFTQSMWLWIARSIRQREEAGDSNLEE